jgi:ABC-type branched-subunit amino acid transport system substrate-binding protein
MKRTRRSSFLAVAASGLLLLGACGDDGEEADTGTTAEGGEEASPQEAGLIDVDACPDDATEPIEGTVRIGSTMPLSGGPAAAAFAPVAEGLRNYIAYANEQGLLPGYEIELTIEDDQYNENLTVQAVDKLLDETQVHLFTSMIGTPQNLAVRDTLNEECYPQMFAATGSPLWGQVDEFPWTFGGLPPYNTETAVYVDSISADFPDGATAAVFYANSEFGQAYLNTFKELAPDEGIDIVAEQTIESASSEPPTSQVNAIAAERPDVILAAPLGAQCPTFLQEVANAKAANSGWEPRIYITSTCASTLLLAISGQAADGIYTIVTGKDPADPKNLEDPEVAAYRQAMTDLGFEPEGDFATAGAGWTAGELTVEVLRQAAASEDGLTRVSIIEAARSLDYHFQLAREGLNFTLDGADDPYGLESMQVVQYDADTSTYTDIGELNTSYEGETVVPEG